MNRNPAMGMKCVKYMLFISNFMFVMVGILLISIGSTINSFYSDFELFMEDYYFSPATLVIVVGAIIMLIAAFGCAAAIKESTCMVNMYALFLLLSLILEISASLAAYAMRVNITEMVESKMDAAMHLYGNNTEATDAIDFLQIRLRCCGIRSQSEWEKHSPFNNNTPYPPSCCRYESEDGSCMQWSRHGCLYQLVDFISDSAVMLATGAISIALVQIIGIAFACMLAKSIRRLKTDQAAQRWQTRQELYLQLAQGHEKQPTPIVYTAHGEPVEP